MRSIVLVVVLTLIAACSRDPYMARKGGYVPGEPYQHQNGLYPGIAVSRAGA